MNAFSFRLDNGATGTMASTGAMRPHQRLDQGFVYTGSKGVLRQDIAGGRLEAQYNDGTADEFANLTEDEAYPAHLPARGLVDVILGEGENRAPGEMGARVVEFLDAGYRSAATGQAVTGQFIVLMPIPCANVVSGLGLRSERLCVWSPLPEETVA